MLVPENVKDLVEGEIQALLLDQDDDSVSFSRDDTLHGIGLNSLMLAQLLIQLEVGLAVDPFEGELSITSVRTVGNLVDAYEHALISATAV